MNIELKESRYNCIRGKYINIEKYRLVETSVFNIPERLREIDPGYFVLFNRLSGKFEVHNSNNIGNSYCLTVPHDELDSRTIDVVIKTRRANYRQIIREMEEHNEKVDRDRANKFRDTVGEITKDIYNYGQRSGDETRIDPPGGWMY